MNNIRRLGCYSENTFENSIRRPFNKLGRRHLKGIDGFIY